MKKRTPKKPKKKSRKLKLLWVIDPWETLDHAKDTTLRLAEEAIALGANCFLAENRAISLVHALPHARVTEIKRFEAPRGNEPARAPNLVVRAEEKLRAIEEFDHVFYRTDPPVDLAYLLPLQLLSAGTRGTTTKHGPRIHSSLESLFFLNEKWAMSYLGKYFPQSLISASPSELVAFARRQGKTVLKPLYQAQSKGVRTIQFSATATPAEVASHAATFLTATEGGKLPVILQEFLPGIARGETRLWFANGKRIAAVQKLPKSGESIIDMDRGGSLAPVKFTAREKKTIDAITKALGALLRREKILFAAVDVIDGKITDFNHTSPGLLVPMEKLLGENLARQALASLF